MQVWWKHMKRIHYNIVKWFIYTIQCLQRKMFKSNVNWDKCRYNCKPQASTGSLNFQDKKEQGINNIESINDNLS